MFNLAYEFKISNITTLIFGVIAGFFMMIAISCAIYSKIMHKKNKNEHIRSISKKAYGLFKDSDKSLQLKLKDSLFYEIKEVIKLVYPDKENAIFELSINDIIFGIKKINIKLKNIVNHPLCNDIKTIHISFLFNVNNKLISPFKKVSNSKLTKFAKIVYKTVWHFINLINPVFYMKLIMNKIIAKTSHKDLFIIGLDIIGNTCYDIYSVAKKK